MKTLVMSNHEVALTQTDKEDILPTIKEVRFGVYFSTSLCES